MMKAQSGITLVALVVTIIVLLILAGVSISMVMGNTGIYTKADEAAHKYANAAEEENQYIQTVNSYVDMYAPKTTTTNP